MAYYYTQINADGLGVGASALSAAVEDPSLIAAPDFPTAQGRVGLVYSVASNSWATRPPAPFGRSVMVTPAALMRRLTLEERQAIRAAAATRPIVADWLDLVRMQPLWRLDDDYIEWGIQGAVQAGLLTAARAKAILGIED
jgi:hypothetical protein